MAANNDSPQSLPLADQVPNIPSLGNEITLGLPENLAQHEKTPSPVAPDEDNDTFLGLYYQVDVAALNDWATVTSFKKGSLGFVVREPKITDNFKQFLILM